MAYKVDFSNVDSFEALPAGVYRVAVMDIEENEGDKGIYFKTTMEVLDGDFKGRKVFTNLSMSPKSAWKLKEALVAFGEAPDVLEGAFDFEPENYLGAECDVAVEQGKYEGRITNSVSTFIPIAPVKGPAKSSTGATPVTGTARPAAGRPKIR